MVEGTGGVTDENDWSGGRRRREGEEGWMCFGISPEDQNG